MTVRGMIWAKMDNIQMMIIEARRNFTFDVWYDKGYWIAINRRNTSKVTCRQLDISSTYGTKLRGAS